jgi:hypothetical protein
MTAAAGAGMSLYLAIPWKTLPSLSNSALLTRLKGQLAIELLNAHAGERRKG